MRNQQVRWKRHFSQSTPIPLLDVDYMRCVADTCSTQSKMQGIAKCRGQHGGKLSSSAGSQHCDSGLTLHLSGCQFASLKNDRWEEDSLILLHLRLLHLALVLLPHCRDHCVGIRVYWPAVEAGVRDHDLLPVHAKIFIWVKLGSNHLVKGWNQHVLGFTYHGIHFPQAFADSISNQLIPKITYSLEFQDSKCWPQHWGLTYQLLQVDSLASPSVLLIFPPFLLQQARGTSSPVAVLPVLHRRECGGTGEAVSSHQPQRRHRDGQVGSQGKGITQPAVSEPERQAGHGKQFSSKLKIEPAEQVFQCVGAYCQDQSDSHGCDECGGRPEKELMNVVRFYVVLTSATLFRSVHFVPCSDAIQMTHNLVLLASTQIER